MAASDLDICNRALAMIGSDPITSIDGTERAADLCRRLYPQLRDELTAAHPWNFATQRASLAASATAPGWEFTTAFPLPADCLRVWKIQSWDPLDPWRVEAGSLVCNLTGPLNIQYIARVTDATQFAPGFVGALAARLAMELVLPLARSEALREQMGQVHVMALRQAKAADAQESNADRIIADVLVQARY